MVKDLTGKGNSMADLGLGMDDCVAAIIGYEELVIKGEAEWQIASKCSEFTFNRQRSLYLIL